MPKITIFSARDIGARLAQDLPEEGGIELAIFRLFDSMCEAANVDPLATVIICLALARRIELRSGRDLMMMAQQSIDRVMGTPPNPDAN